MSQTLEAGVAPPPARADERVARRSPLSPAADPARGRRAARRDRHLHRLLLVAPPFRDADSLVDRAVRQLHLRHPGGRRRAADDRRRVRPVRRRRGDHARRWSPRCSATSSPPTCGSACWSSLVVALVDRVHQRLSGGEDRDPELPGHAGHVLHAARASTWPSPSWSPATSAPTTCRTSHGLRLGAEGVRVLVHDRRRRRSGSRCCGGSCSSSSRPGCCCAPTSATGSSPSAARRPARARSACRSTG